MDSGWIKIYRQILTWRWYKDSYTLHIFLHLMLKASTVDGEYMRWQIKRGQLITSQKNIAEETGIARQSVRTALEHLCKTGEILTKQLTNKGTLITICNFDRYNPPKRTANQASNQALTKHQPSTNQAKEQEFKNIINNISSSNARTRERRTNPENSVSALVVPLGNGTDDEACLEYFFRKEYAQRHERLMMEFSMKSVKELRELAEIVVNQWGISHQPHRDYTDWSNHLVNTMRNLYYRRLEITSKIKNRQRNGYSTSDSTVQERAAGYAAVMQQLLDEADKSGVSGEEE